MSETNNYSSQQLAPVPLPFPTQILDKIYIICDAT